MFGGKFKPKRAAISKISANQFQFNFHGKKINIQTNILEVFATKSQLSRKSWLFIILFNLKKKK